MGVLKKQAVWSNVESVVIPVVERLFTREDELPGVDRDKMFLYAGIGQYDGSGEYASLRTRVVLVASPSANKPPAQLFPVAIGPMLRRLQEEPEAFDHGRLKDVAQETWTRAKLSLGEFPGFQANESYYYAFCREMRARLDRIGPSIERDERGVAWVRGTRVKALEVAASHIAHGWSAEEIRRQHPGLELSSIYAALAWYYEHRAACDRMLAAEMERAEQLRAQQHDSPLRARLKSPERAA